MAIQFTVDHDHTAITDDGEQQLIGDVHFTVQTRPGDFQVRNNGGGSPRTITLPARKAYLGVDGHLYKDSSSGEPFRLVANDPVFGLDHITYRVDFELTDIFGAPIPVRHTFFPAPSTDTTVFLTKVMQDPEQIVMEVRTKGYAEDILDVGVVGLDLITSESADIATDVLNTLTVARPDKFGAIGNGTTNDRVALVAADTSAQTLDVPILLKAGTYRVSSSLTITSPVMLQPGVVIKPDSGVTVTLAGGVTAERSKIFDHSAGGVVVPRNVDFYHPAWWGATGGADDSAAWKAMADSINASAATLLAVGIGQKVLAPCGINRMIGVTLSSCAIHAGLGDSIFVPPNGTTSGVVLALGNYTRLYGGSFTTTESTQAVTCLHLTGQRAQADGVYAFNQAANSTAVKLGNGAGTISPVLTDVRLISGLSTPAAGSIGIDVQSSDAQVSNVNVAQYDVGVSATYGSGRWTNLHAWGNNTGISGTGWDSCQVVNLYLDTNRGWGADLDRIDRAVFQNVYVLKNGGVTASTGGMRLRRTTGNGAFSSFKNVVLDDNVGWGAYIDGPTDYEFDAVINSATVSGGGAVVTTTGVEVTSATTRLTLDVQGTAGATTMLVDSSTTTNYGRWARNVHAATSKTTPADADEFPLWDSVSNRSNKLTVANLKTFIAAWIATLTATWSNKTLNTTNTYQARDDRFSLEDVADPTKHAFFNVPNGQTTATSRTHTLPTVDSTLASLAGTETLINKTLTTPAITSPTGIVKGDVGLGNVDNTSNTTERAATATLSGKSIDLATNTVTGTKAQFNTACTDGDLVPTRVVAGSNTVVNASITLALFMTVPLTASKTYLVRGAIMCAGNQAADMKFRLQASNSTGVTGWFAAITPLRASATSATAESVLAANNADIAATGGNQIGHGLITGTRSLLPFEGYLVTGTGGSQSLDCQVSQQTSDASDTTFYAGSWMQVEEIA